LLFSNLVRNVVLGLYRLKDTEKIAGENLDGIQRGKNVNHHQDIY